MERERDGIEKNQYKVIKVDKEKKNETSISNRWLENKKVVRRKKK